MFFYGWQFLKYFKYKRNIQDQKNPYLKHCKQSTLHLQLSSNHTQNNSKKNKKLQINATPYIFVILYCLLSFLTSSLSLSTSISLSLSLFFYFLLLIPALLSSPTQRAKSDLHSYLNQSQIWLLALHRRFFEGSSDVLSSCFKRDQFQIFT